MVMAPSCPRTRICRVTFAGEGQTWPVSLRLHVTDFECVSLQSWRRLAGL